MPSRKRAKPAASQESARNSKMRKTDVVSTSASGKRAATNAVASGLKIGSDAKDEEDGAKDQDDDNENQEDEKEEEGGVGEIKRGAKQRLEVLEEELGTAKGLLQRNAKILSCNAEFEGDEVSTPTSIRGETGLMLLRSLAQPRSSLASILPKRLANTSRSTSPTTLAPAPVRTLSSSGSTPSDTKSSPAHPRPPLTSGHFAGTPTLAHTTGRAGAASLTPFSKPTITVGARGRTPRFSVNVTSEGLSEVHEALWGPLKALPSSASAADHTERRRTLIRTLRVLLASVCIDYTIACEDGEIDLQPGSYGLRQKYIGWMLEGAEDRWIARGVRKACGFQLTRDPREEIEGNEDRQQKAIGDHDEDCDHEDDEEEEGDGSEYRF
ncbi:hypothetical protein BD779DRAFT_288895 [Infundibulicybe gibba]|nr:hypothetical protein BD779DRAFT_288895 [Infundibulicybe gibba]